MKRLIPLTALASAIFALLCSTAVLLGKSHPAPTPPSLEFCDGTPCYMGIVLNKTTWDEAERIFNNTPGFTLNADHHGAHSSVGYIQDITTSYRYGPIYDISLTHNDLANHDNALSVGMVLNVLGVPCGIESVPDIFNDPSALVVLNYPDRVMYVITDQWRVEPNALISYVDLVWVNERPCGSPDTWRGFRQYLPKYCYPSSLCK